jgi:hypothetical protein
LDLTDAFERLSVGLMIDLDCEIEVPATVRLFAQPDQLEGMLGLMAAIRPLAGLMGQTLRGFPTSRK